MQKLITYNPRAEVLGSCTYRKLQKLLEAQVRLRRGFQHVLGL